ncbi:heavy metal translocating P-type ATPase [Methanolacinia petrolearia DSM 11571]|uniref:Heavy metal translocating P-type ATPase n=1 Tax=Methanolacinia petrolearia (strain DSM 11571 / OCM 486 / SEBR 4847) TaxID=679926 RepID=E1RHI9_METP4|nr:cation-translocating P-type ATPase [Methanolacinia petrolearia]ADN35298.1 heavy metal translocating P-type ATPase [Methanolacinia petrolearia DSM 11571]
MGVKEENHSDSVSCGEICHCGHDHGHNHEHDHRHEEHECGSACACGHDHGHDGGNTKEYAILAVGGILLAAAIAGEYLGLSNIAVSSFAVLSALCTGIPIILSSVRGLLGGRQNVCELAGIAIIAAILIGEYVTAAEVGFILSLGEIAEEYAYGKSRRDIEKIAALHPEHGLVERGGDFVEVPVDEIEVGDTVLIRPGDVVPSDGIVTSGATSVDESCLTGESVPVEKATGDPVYSGSINIDGAVRIEVTKRSRDSTYSKIVDFVREAEKRRPPTYPFIEKFASIYTPLTLVVTALTWIFTGSIERAITILIVACPCALLLSTPSAVISAIGAGARRGILVKSGLYLEEAGKIDSVIFDKTGTLTSGRMRVKTTRAFGGFDEELMINLAAAAECGSGHPVAAAILDFAAEKGLNGNGCLQVKSLPGLGVKGESDSGNILVGNIRFMDESGVSVPAPVSAEIEELSASGISPVLLSLDNEIIGLLGVEDSVRDESPSVVRDLKENGITNVSIVSGDRKEIAESVADKCGIERENVYSGIAPGEKRSIVDRFQKDGKKVCFVGDGVNDAPALAQANAGVAIGSRKNTVAIETSHVVLLGEGLGQILSFIRLGRKTVRTIKINVAFALSFTFILMAMAFLGIVHPAAGALGHQAAVLLVLANSALIPLGMDRWN